MLMIRKMKKKVTTDTNYGCQRRGICLDNVKLHSLSKDSQKNPYMSLRSIVPTMLFQS